MLEKTPLPQYQRIKRYVTDRIDTGELRPGDRVPSENALVRELSVSRMTVNRALRELAAEGRLTRLAGVGTFVAATTPQSTLIEVRSIADEIAERGGRHRAKMVKLARQPADEAVARALHLIGGETVFHVVIVHLENQRPIQIEDRFVNPNVAPDFMAQDYHRMTPSEYLLAHVPLTEIEHVIEAWRASPRDAALLGIAVDDPCLVLNRRTWAGDQVVTQVRFVHPGDHYRLGSRFAPLHPTPPPSARKAGATTRKDQP